MCLLASHQCSTGARPQAQRPRFIDWEATQPLPGEPTDREQPHLSDETNQDTFSTQAVDEQDDAPTGPLAIESAVATNEPESQSPEARRTFWKQLQRIFKSEP